MAFSVLFLLITIIFTYPSSRLSVNLFGSVSFPSRHLHVAFVLIIQFFSGDLCCPVRHHCRHLHLPVVLITQSFRLHGDLCCPVRHPNRHLHLPVVLITQSFRLHGDLCCPVRHPNRHLHLPVVLITQSFRLPGDLCCPVRHPNRHLHLPVVLITQSFRLPGDLCCPVHYPSRHIYLPVCPAVEMGQHLARGRGHQKQLVSIKLLVGCRLTSIRRPNTMIRRFYPHNIIPCSCCTASCHWKCPLMVTS